MYQISARLTMTSGSKIDELTSQQKSRLAELLLEVIGLSEDAGESVTVTGLASIEIPGSRLRRRLLASYQNTIQFIYLKQFASTTAESVVMQEVKDQLTSDTFAINGPFAVAWQTEQATNPLFSDFTFDSASTTSSISSGDGLSVRRKTTNSQASDASAQVAIIAGAVGGGSALILFAALVVYFRRLRLRKQDLSDVTRRSPSADKKEPQKQQKTPASSWCCMKATKSGTGGGEVELDSFAESLVGSRQTPNARPTLVSKSKGVTLHEPARLPSATTNSTNRLQQSSGIPQGTRV